MTGLEAFDLLPEAVLVLDADRVVLHANDRAADLLDLGEHAVGRRLADVVTLVADDGSVCADPVPARGVAQRVPERAWGVRLADGRTRRVVMAGRFLDDDRVTLTFRRGSREPSPRGVARLVAQLAHEVRTPLSTLRGFAATLTDRWEELPDATRGTLIEGIGEGAAAMSGMLDELLDVARVEVDQLRVVPEPVDVAALAGAVVTAARSRPGGRDRRIELEVADDAPSHVGADPRRVRQILTNLVENALVHAPGADVVVSVDGRDGGGVAITVADDGPGIPPGRAEQLFTLFGRGDSDVDGTGIGLYLARALARAHGGDLVVGDQPRDGARFVLTLPSTPTAG